MKHRTLLTCMCGLILFGSCKDQPTQNEQPLEVMTFNIRLDALQIVPTIGNIVRTTFAR